MKKLTVAIVAILVISIFSGCSKKIVDLTTKNLTIVNREIIPSPGELSNTLVLNNKLGDGYAVLENISFDVGTIELELKGENKPGRSFIGVAFNIQNDSTYEIIYFRPFNFQSDEKIRREHSVQYVSQPKNTWRYLRTNYEGQYEAEYPRKPSPDDWFEIRIKIESDSVYVYDKKSNAELLRVERLEKHISNKIGLWTGHNSKGEFKNLRILK